MQDMDNNSFEETDISKASANMEAYIEDLADDKKELIYQKAVSFMESVRCMTACKDKVKMYKNVTEQFALITGYKDADLLMRKCRRNAKKIREEIKKKIYERAEYYQNKAKTATDYKRAADEFRKIKGYLNADELAVQCDKLSAGIEQKGIYRLFLRWGFVVLGILLIVVGLKMPFTKYQIANLTMATGSYHFASGIYEKLGTYRDSEEKLTESKYRNALNLESGDEYDAARKIFAGLGDYKDSKDKEAKLEKQVIMNSKIGDTVVVGRLSWIILDIREDQALLIKKKVLPDMAYHNSSVDVTWETSKLRAYLNSEYIHEKFSAQEQKNILPVSVSGSDNPVYGTKGGNETKDYIFILSTEEAEKYTALLPAVKSDTWLRTPGYSQHSAGFMASDKAVMDYGYDVSSSKLSVLPVMWFDISNSN